LLITWFVQITRIDKYPTKAIANGGRRELGHLKADIALCSV